MHSFLRYSLPVLLAASSLLVSGMVASEARAADLHPNQAITRLEAFRAFTLSAAWASHEEKTMGSLEPGKWADFIVIDRDIFTIPAKDIWSTKVLQTWVGGKKVYSASE